MPHDKRPTRVGRPDGPSTGKKTPRGPANRGSAQVAGADGEGLESVTDRQKQNNTGREKPNID